MIDDDFAMLIELLGDEENNQRGVSNKIKATNFSASATTTVSATTSPSVRCVDIKTEPTLENKRTRRGTVTTASFTQAHDIKVGIRHSPEEQREINRFRTHDRQYDEFMPTFIKASAQKISEKASDSSDEWTESQDFDFETEDFDEESSSTIDVPSSSTMILPSHFTRPGKYVKPIKTLATFVYKFMDCLNLGDFKRMTRLIKGTVNESCAFKVMTPYSSIDLVGSNQIIEVSQWILGMFPDLIAEVTSYKCYRNKNGTKLISSKSKMNGTVIDKEALRSLLNLPLEERGACWSDEFLPVKVKENMKAMETLLYADEDKLLVLRMKQSLKCYIDESTNKIGAIEAICIVTDVRGLDPKSL